MSGIARPATAAPSAAAWRTPIPPPNCRRSCAAYDAVIHVASVRGIRQVPFADFSTGFMATALAPDEMIARHRSAALAPGSRFRLPRIRPPPRRFCARRRRGAARCRRRQCGAPRRASLCGVATSPVRVEAAEARLVGQPLEFDADPLRRGRGVADRAGFRYSRRRRISPPSGAGLERACADRRGAPRRRRRTECRVVICNVVGSV